MIKQILFFVLTLTPGFSFANTSIETFFQGLEGKWHGEVSGVYKIDMDMTAFQAYKPWSLQKGSIKIEEGETTNYEFELSRNKSQIDREAVYFLKLTNLGTKEVQLYTLSHRANLSNPLSFWRHFVDTRDGIEYISANAVKISKAAEVLTWGFVSGNGYCNDGASTSLCATDGYTPYQMQKVTK